MVGNPYLTGLWKGCPSYGKETTLLSGSTGMGNMKLTAKTGWRRLASINRLKAIPQGAGHRGSYKCKL